MSDKLDLLRLASSKISTNKDFFAFFLQKYMEIEQVEEKKILTQLNCDSETYYKLALCKAPAVNAKDYLDRLNNISSYLGISVLDLNKIIKRVAAIVQLRDPEAKDSYLMAARDKKKNDGNTDNLK